MSCLDENTSRRSWTRFSAWRKTTSCASSATSAAARNAVACCRSRCRRPAVSQAGPPAGPDHCHTRATGTPSTENALARGSAFGRYTVLGLLGQRRDGRGFRCVRSRARSQGRAQGPPRRGGGADHRSSAGCCAKPRRSPSSASQRRRGSRGGDLRRTRVSRDGVHRRPDAGGLAGRAARTRKEILDVFVAAGRGLRRRARGRARSPRLQAAERAWSGNDGACGSWTSGSRARSGAARRERSSSPARRRRRGGGAIRAGRTAADPHRRARRHAAVHGTRAVHGERTDARTDQFSFCVALYQALYDVHPFGGGKLGDLHGGGHCWPRSARAAQERRPALVAADLTARPQRRSGAALGIDGRRSPRRYRAIPRVSDGAGWLALAVGPRRSLAAFVVARWSRTGESLCRGGPARLAGVWEPRRAAINPAACRHAGRFLGTGVEGAADWERRRVIICVRHDGLAAHVRETPARPRTCAASNPPRSSICAWPVSTSASAASRRSPTFSPTPTPP